MRSLRAALNVALAVPAASNGCAEEAELCAQSQPVHVVDYTPWSGDFLVGSTTRGTLLTVFAPNGSEAYFGRACGEDPLQLPTDLQPLPARVQPDPRDDDPTLVCDRSSNRLFRLDPTGATPPLLLLPHLSCDATVPTAHGVLVPPAADRGGARLQLFPDFPDESTALTISDDFGGPMRVYGDLVYYRERSGALFVRDLRTGVARHVLAHVTDFRVSATHVLWREQVDADVAPMHLHDLTTGADIYLGLDHAAYEGSTRATPLTDQLNWDFDPTETFVLHLPRRSREPMAAFDLTGAPVSFPAWGQPLLVRSDGAMLFAPDAETLALARPGAPPLPLAIALQPYALSSLAVHDDAVEIILDHGDLYRVPLDGSASALVARGVGSRRFWVDKRHLVTLDRDELVTIHQPTGTRTRLAGRVEAMQQVEDGLYFLHSGPADDRRNGLWFLSAAAFVPPPTLCHGEGFCD